MGRNAYSHLWFDTFLREFDATAVALEVAFLVRQFRAALKRHPRRMRRTQRHPLTTRCLTTVHASPCCSASARMFTLRVRVGPAADTQVTVSR